MHNTFDKAKMLAHLQAEYAFVERTVALVPPDRMEEPGAQGPNSLWTVKDTIAHLNDWAGRARRLVGGGSSRPAANDSRRGIY